MATQRKCWELLRLRLSWWTKVAQGNHNRSVKKQKGHCRHGKLKVSFQVEKKKKNQVLVAAVGAGSTEQI